MVVCFVFPGHLHCKRQCGAVVKARAMEVERLCLLGFEPQTCHKWVCDPKQVI